MPVTWYCHSKFVVFDLGRHPVKIIITPTLRLIVLALCSFGFVGCSQGEDRLEVAAPVYEEPPKLHATLEEASDRLRIPPAGARIEIRAQQREFLIGEEVILDYVVHNDSASGFSFEYGGDYRGTPRATSFEVRGVDASGKRVLDPHPIMMGFGGFAGRMEVPAGESRAFTINLLDYQLIDSTGWHAFEVTHRSLRTIPQPKNLTGTIELYFKHPDPEEAEALVRALPKTLRPTGSVEQSARNLRKRYLQLRSPAYIPALMKAVESGRANGLHGIGGIETPEATRVLIKLTRDPNPIFARLARKLLLNRIPLPSDDHKARWTENLLLPMERKRMAARSWLPEFTAELRAIAYEALKNADEPEGEIDAAFIFGGLGDKQDSRFVIDQVARWLHRPIQQEYQSSPKILDWPPEMEAWLLCTKSLFERGQLARIDVQPEAYGFIQLHLFRTRTKIRLDLPRNQHLRLMGSDNLWIKEAVLHSPPEDILPEFDTVVAAGLSDPRRRIQFAAIGAAEFAKIPDIKAQLSEIIETAEDRWILRSLSNTTRRIGFDFNILQAWTTQLDESPFHLIALDGLQQVFEPTLGGGGGRTDSSPEELNAIQAAWVELLAAKESELQAGKSISRSDPLVTKALFGRARSWRLADGSTWPE